MDKYKMLSGEELVIQGAKKVNSSLPELGLKDIIPNGSWLEQKQIQSSLEARRHIVEVERIEKYGSLSQADWNEKLQLAEVTKNAGGYWQYLGHSIGRQLYLYPEEALYLMEISCLQLKYNDVTVSIQQAYSLLLKDNNSLIQYKVYAALSRLGYRVFRHTYVKSNDTENNETANEAEESSSSEKTCEVTEIDKEIVDTRSMNKETEDSVKEFTESVACEMKNMSNDDSGGTTANVTSDSISPISNIPEQDKEPMIIDKEEQELSIKASNDINKHNECAETAHITEEASNSANTCEVSVTTEDNCSNITDEMSDCQMKDISHDQNRDNIETVMEVVQPIKSANAPDISDEQTENKATGDNNSITSSNVENADITEVNNEINEGSNEHEAHIEKTNTDHKTEELNIGNTDIIQNIESSDEQCSIIDIKESSKPDDCEIICMETEYTDETKVSSSVNLCDEDFKETNENCVEIGGEMGNSGSLAIIQNKIEMLTYRELKPSNSDVVHECINENLPDLFQKQIVTVKAPEEHLIPRNVFLNNTAYVLNLENLKLKSVTPAPSSTRTYSVSDEANEQHVRRIWSGHSNESPHIHFNPQFFPNLRFAQQTPQYRPFNYWNQFSYNWNYQRPFFPSMPLRFQFLPRMHPMFRSIPSRSIFPNFDGTDSRRARKRKRDNPKIYHLESIKKLALKLKGLVASGNRQEQNIQALQRLIDTYNVRYKARIELTAQLDIVENEVILETIDLDDDDQSSSKKKKREEMESYDENFNALKQFSVKIKELDGKKLLTTRHKRAFSNVVKTFNKSYNADVYIDSNFDVIDRRRIIIASSSDSDGVEEIQTTIEETSKPRKSKKLRNPFYILKQLSEKQSPTKTSPETNESSPIILKKKFEYSEQLKKMFNKYWLPNENDFGRAEVPLQSQIRNQVDHCEEFLYQFIKSQPVKFKNWLEAKIAYWQSCKEATLKYEAHSQNESNIKLDSIIKPEDCTNLRNVLTKLSIIKTNKDISEECSLSINFDVYSRDVSNFKKSKKPPPHFMVVCIAESSTFPTGEEFATLHSKYDDVGILFAVVGPSSISYIQINTSELPIYLPTNNLP